LSKITTLKSVANVYWGTITTDIGTSHIAVTDKGICRHSLPGELPEKFFQWIERNFEPDRLIEDPARVEYTRDLVAEYVDGKSKTFECELDIIGTEFQQKVWKEISKLSYGEMVSYQVIANKIELKTGAQAVGTAVGQNPLHLFVPCHRVIGSKGDLRGFAAGTIMKKWLLTHEGALLI